MSSIQSTSAVETAYNTRQQSTEIYNSSASDLVSTVGKEIGLKKERLEMYEKRLSTLLRSLESNPNLAENPVLKDLNMFGKKGKKKGTGNGDKDWMKYQGLMLYSGDPKLGEAQMYFDSLATLRDEIFALEDIEKVLKELIGSGLKGETRCSIFCKDGMPAKLVLRPADEETLPKISLQGRFRIE
ncbi:MAG: hypothetical protein ACE5KU_04650 [Nitrososphaerales archaeon]